MALMQTLTTTLPLEEVTTKICLGLLGLESRPNLGQAIIYWVENRIFLHLSSFPGWPNPTRFQAQRW